MNKPDASRDYGYLPRGGKTEKAFWGLAVVACLIPVVAVFVFGDLGSNYTGTGSIAPVAIGVTVVILVIAAVQIVASLWARTSFVETTVHLSTIRKSKRLMTPVGIPVLISSIIFEIVVGIFYGSDAVLFIIQSFIAIFLSGLFGTLFWYRIRKTERTLPRVGQGSAGDRLNYPH